MLAQQLTSATEHSFCPQAHNVRQRTELCGKHKEHRLVSLRSSQRLLALVHQKSASVGAHYPHTIMLTNSSPLKDRTKTIAAIAVSFLVLAVGIFILFQAFEQIERAAEARKSTRTEITSVATILSELVDAEAGVRGYALTRDLAYLQPYLAVRDVVLPHLAELRALSDGDAGTIQLDAIKPLALARMGELKAIIELRQRDDMPGILARMPAGKRLMEQIRTEAGAFVLSQEAALKADEALYQSKLRNLFSLLVGISGLTVLFTIVFGFLINRESKHRLSQLVHVETKHLLEAQEAIGAKLQAANEALVETEKRLEVTLKSIGDAVLTTDATGLVTLLNPLGEKLTGWTADEAIGRPADEIFHIINEATRLPVVIPIKAALEHGSTQGMINHSLIIARDGNERSVADSCAPIRNRDGTVAGAVLVFRDVTQIRTIERTLLAKNIELEVAKLLAEKANLAKSDFLSSMSHELRTPLGAILGFAQLIESGDPAPTPVQKRNVAQILEAGWYLLDLINEILDLALIESGKISMSLEPALLGDIMRECEAMIEPQATKRGIVVGFSHFDEPYFVRADRTRVKQILVNLLSNAIKYNKPGGTVVVSHNVEDTGYIRISVRDTGHGLTPENLSHLFQPFNRLGQEANGEEGTGIGLVVSKRLVELMGGVIGVESIVGTGTAFWIVLPLTATPQLANGTAHMQPAIADTGHARKPKRSVLYIEDNPANLMLVEQLIARRSDIRLLTAQDGIVGVALARTALPDAILMDINLPGISGIDALKILAQDPLTAHIPVMALSANAIPRDIDKGLAAGFFRYVTKPIRINEFMEALDAMLDFAKLQRPKGPAKPVAPSA